MNSNRIVRACFVGLLFILAVISCQQRDDHKNLAIESDKNMSTDVLSKCKTAIVAYLKNEMVRDPSYYQSKGWGELDSLDALGFKYKLSHQFMIAVKTYIGGKAKDTVLLVDNTFNLDKEFRIVAYVETSGYDDHYDENGLPYLMFGSRELQRIAIANDIDMMHFRNNRTKLELILANELSQNLGISKKDWVLRNFKTADESWLTGIDTIDQWMGLSGEEGFQYVFEDDILAEVKELF